MLVDATFEIRKTLPLLQTIADDGLVAGMGSGHDSASGSSVETGRVVAEWTSVRYDMSSVANIKFVSQIKGAVHKVNTNDNESLCSIANL